MYIEALTPGLLNPGKQATTLKFDPTRKPKHCVFRLFIFKVTGPSPYGTKLACANRATYPDVTVLTLKAP
jgi:hypothetical protein